MILNKQVKMGCELVFKFMHTSNHMIYSICLPSHQIGHWQDPTQHDDVFKWKHFPRYWPFVQGIHRSPVSSPHKGQWRGALMFTLICTRINGWVNNREAGDLRRHRAHYYVIVMSQTRLDNTIEMIKAVSSDHKYRHYWRTGSDTQLETTDWPIHDSEIMD